MRLTHALKLAIVVAAAIAVGLAVLSHRPQQALSIRKSADAREVVTAIAGRHVHGSSDAHMSPDELSTTAVTRRVSLTCTPASLWAVTLLRDAGYEARVVLVLTLDEWNADDNGHTFIEVREGGRRWVAYDIDRKLRWTDRLGRGLSMRDLVAHVPSGRYRIEPLLGALNEPLVRRQDHRWMQVPMVFGSDGNRYFPSRGKSDRRILGYSPLFHVLPVAVWLDRFYGH